jgi:DNA topoisomerase-1
MVEKILEKGAKLKSETKAEVKEPKSVTEVKPAAKKPVAKKPAAKKSAAKKPAAKKTTK